MSRSCKPAASLRLALGAKAGAQGRLNEQRGLRTRRWRTPVSEAGDTAKLLQQGHGASLSIMAWTLVRRLADRVWSSSILEYHSLASRLWRLMRAYTPHGCLLNGDASATVGFTPHIY